MQLQIKEVMVTIYLRLKQDLTSENTIHFLVRKPSYFHQSEEKIPDSSNMEIKWGTVIFSLNITAHIIVPNFLYMNCSVGMQEAAAA